MGSRDGALAAGVYRSFANPSPSPGGRRELPRWRGALSSPPPLGPGGRVFLTGGTGLVGSHLASLLRTEGHPVRALHRRGSSVEFLKDIGCEVIEGSLQDGRDAFARSMEGCSAVVHAAAVIYTDLPWSRVREVNVDGTREVFAGAALAGLRRGVHLSSVTVYGDPAGPTDEESAVDTPLRPRERYARSKRESERVVREVAEESEMAVAILRPSVIYGERDRLFTMKLVGNLRLPLHFVLGSGSTFLPAIYAGNLAHAIVAALRGELEGGIRVFNVTDDFPLTQRDLLQGFADAMGISFRPTPLPRRLVLAGARLGEALGARLPDAEELPLMRAARLALFPNPFLSRRIREELGWSPPYPTDEAITRTARWVQDEAEARRSRMGEG